MNAIKKSLIIIFLILVVTEIFIQGCSEGNEPDNYKSTFGIYLAKDTLLNYWDLKNINMDTLTLQEHPLISDKIINFYDFSSHFIYLKIDKSEIFKDVVKAPLAYYMNHPFFIVVNSKIKQFGVFDPFHDLYSPYPTIKTGGIVSYSSDVIPVSLGTDYYDDYFIKDPRNNEEFKAALLESKKYHAGISIKIDSLIVRVGDNTLVDFKIVLRNDDTDNLYIIDFRKEQKDLTVWGGGVYFYNKLNQNKYSSFSDTLVTPNPFNKVDMNWYIKLKAGESIEKMFKYIKYKNIAEGDYYVFYKTLNPDRYVTKAMRELKDGRIHLGQIRSNVIDLTIDKDRKCKINNWNVIFE